MKDDVIPAPGILVPEDTVEVKASELRSIALNSRPVSLILERAKSAANNGLSFYMFEVSELDYNCVVQRRIHPDREQHNLTPLVEKLLSLEFKLEDHREDYVWSPSKYFITIWW